MHAITFYQQQLIDCWTDHKEVCDLQDVHTVPANDVPRRRLTQEDRTHQTQHERRVSREFPGKASDLALAHDVDCNVELLSSYEPWEFTWMKQPYAPVLHDSWKCK